MSPHWPVIFSAAAPPSMTNSAPVVEEDSSDARNCSLYDTLSTDPVRPSGTLDIDEARPSSVPANCAIISVSIGPGCIELALIPSAACRIALYLANIPTLAFDVPYAPPTRSPAIPAIDDVPRSLDRRRRVCVEGPSGDQSVEAPADRREVLPGGGCGDHIAIPIIHYDPGTRCGWHTLAAVRTVHQAPVEDLPRELENVRSP